MNKWHQFSLILAILERYSRPKEMSAKLLKKNYTTYLCVLGVCRMVSNQDERENMYIDICLFYPWCTLIRTWSQPASSDLQNQPGLQLTKQLLTSVKENELDLMKMAEGPLLRGISFIFHYKPRKPVTWVLRLWTSHNFRWYEPLYLQLDLETQATFSSRWFEKILCDQFIL